MPEKIDLRQWTAIIKYADQFLGCDSVGQHLSYIVDTPCTVVIGQTYPINTSYAKTKNISIIDIGQLEREYDPIRITVDERVSRQGEKLMWMSKEIEDLVVKVVLGEETIEEEDE